MSLNGKVVLVTGAQEGIGRSIAIAFAKDGANVGVNWLDKECNALEVENAIKSLGANATLVKGDVSKVEDVSSIVTKVIQVFGSIDFLVNNAGVFPRVPFLDMKEHDWDHVINVNLKGSFFCSQAVAEFMISSGKGGCIVNLASQAINGNAPNGVHYVASKSGIVGLTRALAIELAEHNIRVNCVAPGLTDTSQPRYGSSEKEIANAVKKIPIARIIQPAEIATLTTFLCSENASMITGQTYHVNGGAYLV